MTLTGGVDPLRYLPAFVSQRRTALAADGVDDCRVIAAQALAAAASAGETQRTARGQEMGIGQLVRQAVAMRDNLDQDEQTGPLDTSHTTRMIELMWPRFPLATPDDIGFSELVERLFDGWCASISGNPARIRGDSPLKRAGDVGHEFALMGARVKDGERQLLVYDPYLMAPKGQRGEWRPAKEVKQFAYRDSDQDLLAVFTERKGSWTEARLTARRLNAKHAVTEATLRARIDKLEARLKGCGSDDCEQLLANARAAAHESAHVASIEWHEQQRSTGPGGAP